VEKVSGAVPPSEPSIGFSCSDETSNLSVGLKFTFHIPYSLNLTGVFMSVNDAPTGDDLIVDIQFQGASIFSTLPSITSGRQYGGDRAVFSVLYLPVDSKVTVYINQVGSTNAGTGLKVWLLGTKTPCDLPPYFCNTYVNSGCVSDFGFAWKYCSSISTFPAVDTSSGNNFSYAWKGCTSLTSFPLLDTSFGTNFVGSWDGCTSLTSFPLLDTSFGINFINSWYGCTSLTSFPLLDVNNGLYFNSAWGNCTSLTSFPLLSTNSAISFYRAWANCTSLTSFPLLSFNSSDSFGTAFYGAWENCTSLASFPANMFDTCVANNFTNSWYNCALDQTSVDNILVSLDTAGQRNGTVGINGGTSAAPSATGLAAKSSLEGKGWTVLTN
jgi:hypothetical protein